MEDLSLHILDIAENAVNAGATALAIAILEDTAEDILTIDITDNGEGMDAETVEHALDPFYTTRSTRRIGLGLPLLHEAATTANGFVEIRSVPGYGTTVKATFQLSHIDRKPLGDIAETITVLATGWPDTTVTYRHRRGDQTISFSSADFRQHLNGAPLNCGDVIGIVREYLHQQENSLSAHV